MLLAFMLFQSCFAFIGRPLQTRPVLIERRACKISFIFCARIVHNQKHNMRAENCGVKTRLKHRCEYVISFHTDFIKERDQSSIDQSHKRHCFGCSNGVRSDGSIRLFKRQTRLQLFWFSNDTFYNSGRRDDGPIHLQKQIRNTGRLQRDDLDWSASSVV